MRVRNNGERTRRTGSRGGHAARGSSRTGTTGWSGQECPGKRQRWNGASGTAEGGGSGGGGEERQRQHEQEHGRQGMGQPGRKKAAGANPEPWIGASEATEHPGGMKRQAGKRHGNRTGTTGEEAQPKSNILGAEVEDRQENPGKKQPRIGTSGAARGGGSSGKTQQGEHEQER